MSGVDVSNVENFSWNMIGEISDSTIQESLKEEYMERVGEIKSAFPDFEFDREKPLFFIVNQFMDRFYKGNFDEQMDVSNFLFPGQKVKLYPNIRITRSHIERNCSFCSDKIYIGSKWIRYNPIFYNFTTKRRYKLEKPLAIKEDHNHSLPNNFTEFEELSKSLHSYDGDELFNYYPNNDCTGNYIDFDHLRKQPGALHLAMLRQTPKETLKELEKLKALKELEKQKVLKMR